MSNKFKKPIFANKELIDRNYRTITLYIFF